MTTQRKRPGNVAAQHLRAADTAIQDSITHAKDAERKRHDADRLLTTIQDIDYIKRHPAAVERALLIYSKLEAEARALDAKAKGSAEEASKYIIAALYAHKEE